MTNCGSSDFQEFGQHCDRQRSLAYNTPEKPQQTEMREVLIFASNSKKAKKREVSEML